MSLTSNFLFIVVFRGKCGHPDSGDRSEALLNAMLKQYDATGDPDVRPDGITFNSVMHAIANSDRADGPQRAMRLLERMKAMGGRTKPDIISYNSVLNAFAKSGGTRSASRAEEMLHKLENSYDESRKKTSTSWDVCPDLYSYNIVISAWANCGNANRAVALLDRMAHRTKEGTANLSPDATTYNSVLHAWSQSSDKNAPVKALGLLEIMIRLHNARGEVADDDDDENVCIRSSVIDAAGCILDVTSFSTVINAFSKSRFPRKARQTRELLRRMKLLHENGRSGGGLGSPKKKKNEALRPNIFVYAAVLNACAYTFGTKEEKDEALKIGIEIYEELQISADIETNHVAYGSFIRLCRKLMKEEDPRRDDFVTQAFQHCCSDGQLGEYVVRQIRPMTRLYTSLFKEYITEEGGGEVRYLDLPATWRCNVKDRSKYRLPTMDHSVER